LKIGIGWRGVNEDVERFKDNLEFTKLKNNQEGIDRDDAYSQFAYEKGFQFAYLYSLHYIILLTIFCVF
jgi:leukotriene-A4 hydrolase